MLRPLTGFLPPFRDVLAVLISALMPHTALSVALTRKIPFIASNTYRHSFWKYVAVKRVP
jgi:hypothetical protein